LPAFAASALFLDRQDHLMTPKELKSLTDRAFTNSQAPLNMVKIKGAGGDIEERVDLGD
jgi:hypothetical protein